jgi:hypothetical protein
VRHDGSPKSSLARQPVDRVTRLSQHHLVGFDTGNQALFGILKDIEIIRDANSIDPAIEHCSARDVAIRPAIRRYQESDNPLEIA